MDTGQPNLCKILQINNNLRERKSFRIVFPLDVDVISKSQSHILIFEGASSQLFIHEQPNRMKMAFICLETKMIIL